MASQHPPMSMSEPNAALVLTPLSLDISVPTESENGSTAQATPTSTPVPPPPAPPPTVAHTSITFLVISGRRRTMSFDPSLSIGRVKELVWLSWHSDWSDERPPAPSYLRILYLGKLLQDDVVLDSIHNPLAPVTTMSASPSNTPPHQPVMIMHLSIRPTPAPGEADDLKKKRKRIGRRASSASGTPDETDGGGEDSNCCAGCIVC